MPETKKPYVLITVLCSFERHGWINPGLLETLVMATHDPRFAVEIRCLSQYHRVEHARNVAVDMARAGNVDWLVQVDNDQNCKQLMDIIWEADTLPGVDICGLATGTIQGESKFAANVDVRQPIQLNGKFVKVNFAGTGIFLVRNNVINALPKPPKGKLIGKYFQWDMDHEPLPIAEDQFFCGLVQALGFTLWTHAIFADHYHTVNLTPLVPGIRK